MTLLHDGVRKIKMANHSEVLERAWYQLELENPEYVVRLRQLKAGQQTNDGQTIIPGIQHHPLSSTSDHVQQVFKYLSAPEFAFRFGDVTLVFEDGERVFYYRSILSLISFNWKKLFQHCNNSDLIILTEVSKKEFFKEVLASEKLPTIYHKEDVPESKMFVECNLINKEFLEESVLKRERERKNRTEIDEKGNFNIVSPIQKTCADEVPSYDNLLQTSMTKYSEKKLFKKSRAIQNCPDCGKAISGGNLKHHIQDNHRKYIFKCKLCQFPFTRPDSLKKHNCKFDPSRRPFKCTRLLFCDKMFSSEKSEKEHRRSGRCTTFMCNKCGEKFMERTLKYAHEESCQIINRPNIAGAFLETPL